MPYPDFVPQLIYCLTYFSFASFTFSGQAPVGTWEKLDQVFLLHCVMSSHLHSLSFAPLSIVIHVLHWHTINCHLKLVLLIFSKILYDLHVHFIFSYEVPLHIPCIRVLCIFSPFCFWSRQKFNFE